MDRKGEILELLEFLKRSGKTRSIIEAELGYSENYINQQIAKGGNGRFLKALQKYRNDLVHHEIAKSNIQGSKNPADSEESYRAKYIRQLEKENEVLQDLVKSSQEIIKTNLTLVLATVRTISVRQEATGGIVLESLARLEKKPEKSLVAAGDKRRDQIEREAHKSGNATLLSK